MSHKQSDVKRGTDDKVMGQKVHVGGDHGHE